MISAARLVGRLTPFVLVVRHGLQRILGPARHQDDGLVVARELEVAPLHRDVLGADAEEAADRHHHGLDGAAVVDIDVLDLAHGLAALVAHRGADQGVARHLARGVEVAGRGGGRDVRPVSRLVGRAVGRRPGRLGELVACRPRRVGRTRRVARPRHPRAGVGEDLAAPRLVLVLVLRLGLEFVLGHVDRDLLAVVGDPEIGPGDADLAVADAQETADARQDAVDLAVLVDVDRLDLADRLTVGVLDVAADQLAGVGSGRRRHLRIGHLRIDWRGCGRTRRLLRLRIRSRRATGQECCEYDVLEHLVSLLEGRTETGLTRAWCGRCSRRTGDRPHLRQRQRGVARQLAQFFVLPQAGHRHDGLVLGVRTQGRAAAADHGRTRLRHLRRVDRLARPLGLQDGHAEREWQGGGRKRRRKGLRVS